MKKSHKTASIVSAAVMAIELFPVIGASAAETNVSDTITGLANGYYDVTATYENSSVDGSCYMWARSSSSSMATTVLPKSTSTSGTTVKVKGVYVDDGTLEYGLYNDGTSTASISNVTATASSEYTFLNGGDISEYTLIHDKGGKYYALDGTTEVNPISYLGGLGMNACRIRLSNTPGSGHGDGTYYLPAGYQDKADCLELAKTASDAGMDIVFTFNYSDYWSNAERQRIPSDWVAAIKNDLGYDIENKSFLNNMTSAQKTQIVSKLGDLVYSYTKDVMQSLAEQGSVPAYVSLGNEINGGMFFPFACSYGCYFDTADYSIKSSSSSTTTNWIYADFASLASILNRGYDAVKEVSPSTGIIMHLASDGGFQYSNAGNHKWWYDAYKSAGGKWDVTGISYYPSWTVQTASVCKARVNELSSIYSKPVILMEAGYNWADKRKDGYDGQLYLIDAYKDIYPNSQSGHKGFMAELINYMKEADNCIGVLYWDPLKIHVENSKGDNLVGWAISENGDYVQANVVENTTLFDFSGKAISTVQLYADTKSAKSTAVKITPQMTYVDYNNPSTAYGYIATAKAGYNKISNNNTIAFANTGWNCNWITYLKIDASSITNNITCATLSIDVSGSTDSKRTTTYGAMLIGGTSWDDTLTYKKAGLSGTLIGDTVSTTTKSATTFETKTINITDALKNDDDKIITIAIYETAAAGGYIKNPSVNIKATDDTDYKINSFTLDNHTASASITNNTADAVDVTVIVAVYASDGTLVSTKLNTQTVEAGATNSISATNSDNGTVKAFLWDMPNSNTPLTEVK